MTEDAEHIDPDKLCPQGTCATCDRYHAVLGVGQADTTLGVFSEVAQG